MNQFLQGQHNSNLPTSIAAPDTPLHEQAAQRANANVGAYGADISKFYSGMMNGQGGQDLSNITRNMRAQGRMSDQNVMNQIRASGMPLNSTAMMGAMTNALSQNAMNRNVQMGQLELGNANQANALAFQGAQGLSGMPSYFSQPANIEAQMLGLRLPYDMAGIENQRLNAQLNNQNLGYAAQLGRGFLDNNWYQPEHVVMEPQQSAFWPALLQAGGMLGMGALMGSDKTLKEDITTIEDTGAKIDKLRGVVFKWTPSAHILDARYTGTDYGVIAQEAEEVIPEAVVSIDGIKQVNYASLTGLLIEEVKALRSRVASLEGAK